MGTPGIILAPTLSHNSSMSCQAFRKQVLAHHPDKGGSTVDFQAHTSIDPWPFKVQGLRVLGFLGFRFQHLGLRGQTWGWQL